MGDYAVWYEFGRQIRWFMVRAVICYAAVLVLVLALQVVVLLRQKLELARLYEEIEAESRSQPSNRP